MVVTWHSCGGPWGCSSDDRGIDQPEILAGGNVAIWVRDSGEDLVLLAGLSKVGTSPHGTCCLMDHEAGRHRTCRQNSAGCAAAGGVSRKLTGCQAVVLQGWEPRPRCSDKRRPEASFSREGIAMHRTRHPGSLWPAATRQQLSPYLEKISWRTDMESWK